MPYFNSADYINARKYQLEQENKNPWLTMVSGAGQGIGSGMVKGADRAYEEQQTEKKTLMEQRQNDRELKMKGFMEYLKENILYDKTTKQPLDITQAMQIGEQWANGGSMPSNIGAQRIKTGDETVDKERLVFDPNSGTYKPSGVKYKGKANTSPEVDRMATAREKTDGKEEQLRSLNIARDNVQQQINSIKQRGSGANENIDILTQQLSVIDNKIAELMSLPTVAEREVQPEASLFRRAASAVPFSGVAKLPPKQKEMYLKQPGGTPPAQMGQTQPQGTPPPTRKFAVNPTTKQRIYSDDGITWYDATTNQPI